MCGICGGWPWSQATHLAAPPTRDVFVNLPDQYTWVPDPYPQVSHYPSISESFARLVCLRLPRLRVTAENFATSHRDFKLPLHQYHHTSIPKSLHHRFRTFINPSQWFFLTMTTSASPMPFATILWRATGRGLRTGPRLSGTHRLTSLLHRPQLLLKPTMPLFRTHKPPATGA